MKKGALPVPYIVAILIALVVIVLLLYWLYYVGFIKFNPQIDRAACESKRIPYCTAWAASNYATDQKTGEPINPPGPWDRYAADCVQNNAMPTVTETDCRKALGQQK